MAFEKTAIAAAEDCGIYKPYFYEGTMFFAAEDCGADSIAKLQQIFPKTVVSKAGDEIAVDFVV